MVWSILTLVAGVASASPAYAADQDAVVDAGPTAGTESVSVSLILKVRHASALERFVADAQEPGQSSYHRFLSLRDFTATYSPSTGDITSIKRYLARYGISVSEVYADRLLVKASGPVSAFNAAFSLDVHDYVRHGRRFHHPRHAPRIPALLRDLLVAIAGPSTEPMVEPRLARAAALPAPFSAPTPTLPKTGATTTGVPGSFTVGDAAELYGAGPLYDRGFDGSGRTIGIVTLAGFQQNDVFNYWDMVGLDVDPLRIKQVHVDGGGLIDDPNDPAGPTASVETVLDVEQAGGIAPGADLVVYDAPNTGPGFFDLFYRAVSDNLVDSISVSWGGPEVLSFDELGGVTAQLVALHQAFLEAAAQGISVFAASGDAGAYDANSAVDQPVLNLLAVDSPASDPLVTAAGGTTVPYTLAITGTPGFVVSKESVWGWKPLEDFLVAYVDPTLKDALFPVGTGGGVSVYWARPSYQSASGFRDSEPGQSVVLVDETGPTDLFDLPAGFAGRNVPDVSLNADPETGYLVYSAANGGLLSQIGGTSVVAPELNGMNALVTQSLGMRVGAWNPMLYRFKKAYRASKLAPLVDVTAGDNWFYAAAPGYEPGAGLGVLRVANFAVAIGREGSNR